MLFQNNRSNDMMSVKCILYFVYMGHGTLTKQAFRCLLYVLFLCFCARASFFCCSPFDFREFVELANGKVHSPRELYCLLRIEGGGESCVCRFNMRSLTARKLRIYTRKHARTHASVHGGQYPMRN